MTRRLDGKVAIVTGATVGLGYEIARQFLAAGARVTICARDTAAVEVAGETLRADAGSEHSVEALRADVTDPVQLEAMVDRTLDVFGRLDVLVNNAGVYGPKGPVESVDWKEWVRAVEINLLGSVLCARAVLPHFKSVRRGKIIQLSGGGATSPLPMLSAYAVAKAGVVRFVETLAEEVRQWGIEVNAIAPGALNTRLLDEILEAGPERVGQEFYDRSVRQKQSGGAPLETGASLAVFLASSASDGITGRLISALWDRWDAWPEHLDELERSDAYTLRRVTGKDRGFSWGDR